MTGADGKTVILDMRPIPMEVPGIPSDAGDTNLSYPGVK